MGSGRGGPVAGQAATRMLRAHLLSNLWAPRAPVALATWWAWWSVACGCPSPPVAGLWVNFACPLLAEQVVGFPPAPSSAFLGCSFSRREPTSLGLSLQSHLWAPGASRGIFRVQETVTMRSCTRHCQGLGRDQGRGLCGRRGGKTQAGNRCQGGLWGLRASAWPASEVLCRGAVAVRGVCGVRSAGRLSRPRTHDWT